MQQADATIGGAVASHKQRLIALLCLMGSYAGWPLLFTDEKRSKGNPCTPTPSSPRRAAAVVALLARPGSCQGCKSAPAPATDDAILNTQVQTALSSDQNLSGQSIQASVADGVVTLSGNVSSDTARSIASQAVAQIAGVRTVVNNLVVGGLEQ